MRYCPVCYGFEVIGQHVVVLISGPQGVREALYLRHFTDRLSAFRVSETVELTPDDAQALSAAGIKSVAATVRSVRLWDGRVTINHGDAETTCDTLYSALGMRVHSESATALGAVSDPLGYLDTDQHQQTSILGLYAAGDGASGLNQISVATGEAATAASAIHRALLGAPSLH